MKDSGPAIAQAVDTGFPSRCPAFNPTPDHVGFIVDSDTGPGFRPILRFRVFRLTPQLLDITRTLIMLSSDAV
jgi:hypothetical protein